MNKGLSISDICNEIQKGNCVLNCETCNDTSKSKDIDEFGNCSECAEKYIKVGERFYKNNSNCRILKIRFHYVYSDFGFDNNFVELPRISKEQLDKVSITAYDKQNNKEIIFWADYFEEN